MSIDSFFFFFKPLYNKQEQISARGGVREISNKLKGKIGLKDDTERTDFRGKVSFIHLKASWPRQILEL